MNSLEIELKKHVETLHLKEKAFSALLEIKKDIIKDGGKIDGYAVDEMLFTYSRHELRFLKNLNVISILAKYDIFIKDKNLTFPIGYYDYEVDFSGNFLDDYFVIEKEKK